MLKPNPLGHSGRATAHNPLLKRDTIQAKAFLREYVPLHMCLWHAHMSTEPRYN